MRRVPVRNSVVGLALAASGCFGGFHWGDDSSTTDTQPGTSEACEPTQSDSGTGSLPARPGGPPSTGSESLVFAISKVYYGDSDRNGTPSRCAWTAYGLNIDGKTTYASSTDVCALVAGSSQQVQVDGQNGIDNSFGANMLPVLQTVDAYVQSGDALGRDDSAIELGAPTMLVRLDQLGAGPSYASIPGGMVRATASGAAPRWDGSDVRNVNAASLADDAGTPLLAFPGGYLTRRTWIGAPPAGPGLVELNLGLTSLVTPLPITHVQVSMTLGPSDTTASGVLSGVVPAEGMAAWMKTQAGFVSTSLCSGSAFESIAMQIEQMSDIMVDGTSEPGQVCNGISLGVGFDAVAVHMGPSVAVPAAPDPCADAGGGD